ncbi:UvrD-helicase domain-containing protein [Paenibacillus pabuli]|uniref:UvrD-helicase domain-containing protein n=1 Tax=Paenibacillus pabuli TaxID=1472 RepID=UPI001FFFCC23|nr:UvrD-helicase domain-containing protein [Paenibacillus pabuli]UPK47108.1 UvrD-helicase domain-containing protein [Paenibacillus pabuli]
MLSPNSTFYPRPLGVTPAASLPQSPSAPLETSRQLVASDERDAPYFRSLEEVGIRLNGPQISAVRHGKGPLLTLAGAGCGKTTVLAARAGYLMEVRGAHAGSILLVTFTNKAATEMKERIASLPGIRPASARAVQARTFHSFALTLLRHYGVQEEIFGESRAQHTVLKMLLRQNGMSEAFQPESLLAMLSAWKMQGSETSDLPEKSQEERDAKRVLLGYETWKRDRNKMDFDDILLRAAALLRDPAVLGPLQQRFQYIMVDEFQDTNSLQYEIVQKLAAAHRNLMVVGDDDQTIYTFNGARQESILEFDKVYPGARIVTLDINYRSDARILGLGSELVARNKRRRDKRLRAAGHRGEAPRFATPSNAEEEAAWVVNQLCQQVEEGLHTYRDIAILHRTASSSRAIFEQLVLKDVPFVQHGASPVFYDQSLIRPLMDHMRLSLNPRAMDALPSALGPLYVSRDAGLEWIQRSEEQQAKKYPLIHLAKWDKLKPFQQEQVKERIKLIKSLTKLKPVIAIQEMRRQFYDKYMESGDPSIFTHYKETMLETLDEFEAAAKKFETVEEFIQFADELSRRHREMESLRRAQDSDAVQLMTIHRAKGLEFPCVYWIGASEGIVPHSTALRQDIPEDQKAALTVQQTDAELDMALEEERRLAYVAITRAKQHLYVTSPASHHGKPADVSRFLLEAFGMEVPDKRKNREDGPTGNHASYGSGSSNWRGNGNTNGKANGSENRNRNGNAAYARSGSRPQGRDAVSPVQRGSDLRSADQRSAIRQSDRRDFEVLDERDEDRLSERRGSGVIGNHKAFSTTGVSQTASSSNSSESHSSGAEHTETVAIWKCSSSTCKAWLRQKPDGPSAKVSKKAASGPPACPLCSGTMEASTRKVPVTGRFGR